MSIKKTADRTRAEGYVKQKKKLEWDLAKKMRDHFNTGTLKIQLNTMIANALRQMVEIDGWQDVWTKNVGILKALSAYGSPANTLHHADCASISPEFCGDLIRLYGEVLEEAEKGPLDAQRRAAQLGGADYWDKPKGFDKIVPKMNLNTGKYPDPPGTRVRLGTTEKRDMSYSMVPRIRKFDPGFDPFVRDERGNYVFNKDGKRRFKSKKVKPVPVERRAPDEDEQIGAGMVRWIPQANDLLCRVETTFGLRIGATISGTTTDTIFFVNRFMRDLQCIDADPIFYMLPFATIASEGHHSLIETALPLALHGKIDYSIGLYSGLLPIGSRHYAARAIKATLKSFEDSTDNRLLLAFFRQRQEIGGCWEFAKTGSDRQVFERMAKADENMLKMFSHLKKGYATELMLDGWYRKSRRGQANAPALLM